MANLNLILAGASTMASLVIALFFLRFWRRTGDSLFVYFALSFALESALRVYMALSADPNGTSGSVYLLRLLCYGFIVAAIIGKNRRARRRDAEPAA